MHRLVRKGLTNKAVSQELVRLGHLPATSAAITAWKNRHGYPVRSSTEARLKLIPWKVAVKDSRHRFYVCLALEARDRSGGALAMKDRKRLAGFKQELGESGGVIHYDRINGWRLVRPRVGIDTDMIRDPRRDDRGRVIPFDPKV